MSNFLALDVGTVRVGVAIANMIARLPSPYKTLDNNDDIFKTIAEIIKAEDVDTVIVGLPRNLSGDDTDQTRYCRDFGNQLAKYSKIEFQDEALTSHKAEAELKSRGKVFSKGDIDALAATYILEDYLAQQRSDS